MRGRWLTRLAVGVLLIDAALLLTAGVLTRRPSLLVIAAILLLSAAGVIRLGRGQRARWAAVDQARREVRDEARVLAELLRRIRGRP